MITLYKYLAVIGIILVSLLGAYYYGRESVPLTVQTIEKTVNTVTQSAVVERIVYRDRETEKQTTTIKKPDGTVITTEDEKSKDLSSTDDKTSKTTTTVAEKDSSKTVSSGQSGDKNYMVGVYKGVGIDLSVHPKLEEGQEIIIGRRLFGSFWINGGFNTVHGTKEVLVGISYEW